MLALAQSRVGQPKHTADQLLHFLGGAYGLHRAEDVGEGTIPALLQRLDGDDEVDLGRRGQRG